MKKLLICLLILILVISVTGCGDKHTHEYSNDYSYDATYHWREATCGCQDQVSDKEKHNFVDDICSCGYERESTPENPPINPPEEPDIDSDVIFDGSDFQ